MDDFNTLQKHRERIEAEQRTAVERQLRELRTEYESCMERDRAHATTVSRYQEEHQRLRHEAESLQTRLGRTVAEREAEKARADAAEAMLKAGSAAWERETKLRDDAEAKLVRADELQRGYYNEAAKALEKLAETQAVVRQGVASLEEAWEESRWSHTDPSEFAEWIDALRALLPKEP